MKKHKVKLGGTLRPQDMDPDTGCVLLPTLNDGPSGDEWGCSRVSAGFCLDLNPALLLDAMTRAVLLHTRGSIIEGKRPDNGAAQVELSKRALANPARQSPNRGYSTGLLADHLKRDMTSDGQTAKARIIGPPARNAFLAQQRARGINLLTLAGKSGDAMREAAEAVVAGMATGREVLSDTGDVDAEDA